MRTLILFLYGASLAAAAPDKECLVDAKHFATNTPQNILKILRSAQPNTFQFGYTFKEFEFGLRLYLLQPPEERKKIYAEILADALKPKTVYEADNQALFSLIIRDPLARELWEKRDKKAKPVERYQKLAAQLKKLPPPNLGMGEVKKILESKPKNGTAVLAALPAAYRENYAVMFESGASQESSDKFPRGIFFNDDVVTGFNGNSQHNRYENIEFMHLNASTATTDLYETAPNDDKTHAELSPPNPALCNQCHGPSADPFTKWMSYNFWRGAIAGHEDVLRGTETKEGKSLTSLLEQAETNLPEKKEANERYKLFENLKNHFDPEKNLARTNNGRLNRALNLHSMTRMLRLMAATPNFCKYRYAVQAAVIGCEDIQSFIPENVHKDFSSYATIAADTKALGAKLDEEFKKAYPQPSEQRAPSYFFEEKKIANLRYLFEGRGISMNGWSSDHVTGYGWSDGTYELRDFAILLNYAHEDLYENSAPYTDCKSLREQSLLALKAMAPQEPADPPPAEGKVHTKSPPARN